MVGLHPSCLAYLATSSPFSIKSYLKMGYNINCFLQPLGQMIIHHAEFFFLILFLWYSLLFLPVYWSDFFWRVLLNSLKKRDLPFYNSWLFFSKKNIVPHLLHWVNVWRYLWFWNLASFEVTVFSCPFLTSLCTSISLHELLWIL